MATITHLIQSLTTIPPLAVYAFVLLWLAAESCGFPLPNELVLLLTGSLASQGRVSPFILVGVAVVGSLIGASAAYLIGKVGGRVAVLRVGRYVRLDEKRFASVETWFARSGTVAIFLSRITPFVRTVASFPAGVLRMPLRNFLLATALGSLIWCSVLVGVGDALGADYGVALTFIQRYTIPAIIVLVALIVGYLWLHNRLSHVGQAKPEGQMATKVSVSATTTTTTVSVSATVAPQKTGMAKTAKPSMTTQSAAQVASSPLPIAHMQVKPTTTTRQATQPQTQLRDQRRRKKR